MSESEVTQIRDEDVLRRMWQQTEDFSRKKEIRAHMYRLREERLRNLYSPEPTPGGKGCEFTSEQGHVKSFADQNFQSMKSKEVRDAGSPPKEFTYRGQDLKDLSNAGWNVESENRTSDDGRTHVKSVNANIEGRYDVEGGRGQFAAVDRQRQATTEYRDDNSSLRRDESSSNTAAHEHVVRQTDDGTRVSSTTSSSNTSSKFQQVSSTKSESVPYLADDDYDIARRTAHDTNRNEQLTRITNKNDYEQTLRKSDFSDAELVSRKVEYPDDHTKVIVETRCLPDGTRVTSTRREFRAPAQSTRSEYQTKSESKSYTSQHKSDSRDLTSKITRHTVDNRSDDIVDSQSHHKYDTRDSTSKINRPTIDNRSSDIVDSQRTVDDNDFKRQIRQYTVKDNNDYSNTQQHYVTTTDKKVTDYTQTEDDFARHETRFNNKVIDHTNSNRDDIKHTQHRIIDRRNNNTVDETDRRQVNTKRDDDIQQKVVKETRQARDTETTNNITRDHTNTDQKIHHISRDTTATEKEVRNIQNRSVSEKIVYDIPNNKTIPDEGRDIPRDGIVPDERFCEIPRDKKVPEDKIGSTIFGEKTHNFPTNGSTPKEQVHDISRDRIVTDEKVHNVTQETKMENLVERKTSNDHYQTTYQNDFQSRKISTDWSPTHQAWASTLRSDTPTNTRPSTRASSPGSRTFKSSTSSLRSSVSPDKSPKKPLSRGGSPNKIDRLSPTRTVTSDRYSSTHSTNFVTEVRTNRTTSPEQKPPTGRWPRHVSSPDRKPHDVRHRPSASPEKRPYNVTSSSPERKPSQQSFPTDRHQKTSPSDTKEKSKSPVRMRHSPENNITHHSFDENPYDTKPKASHNRSNISPEKKSTDGYPNRSSPRCSPSPDRKSGYKKPDEAPAAASARPSSPSRPSYSTNNTSRKLETSPHRTPNNQQPTTSYRQSPDKRIDKGSPSVSPDRNPNFMKPTVASQADDKTKRSSKQEDITDRRSPTKQIPAQSPDRKPQNFNKTTKITEDHYRFVDEETKVYNRTEKTETENKATELMTAHNDSLKRDKKPSPTRQMPSQSSPAQTEAVKIVENDELYGRIDKTVELNISIEEDNQTDNNIKTKGSAKNKKSPENVSKRETSPTKYETCDKMKPSEDVNTTEVTTVIKEDHTNKDIKYDTHTHRRNKIVSKNFPDIPLSPKKESPRDSTSPMKSPSKDVKYKHTTDFLSKEINTEQINKKTTAKERPRQLVTPSSSPTRKSKITETEPSTGQSSPTTSVSGFVYFSSPRTEEPMITDLDDFYPDPENISKRPDTLDAKKSPSPSKIPCRSPSPEKHVPTVKDKLPRKSSLKKPAIDVNMPSPIEKPPTSFRVSPTDDKPDVLEHKVIIKDRLSEPETGEPKTYKQDTSNKPKPPLQRRETYEDRCKKILGMINDKTTESKETRKYTSKPDSSQSSPSISPCGSPTHKESFRLSDNSSETNTMKTKVDVTDYITHEKTEFHGNRSEILSKESSTKPQDIVTKTTPRTTQGDFEKDLISKDAKSNQPSLPQCPIIPDYLTTGEIEKGTYISKEFPEDLPKDRLQKRTSESPERKPSTFTSSSSQRTETLSSKLNMSPERKPVHKSPKEVSPSRNPEKSSGSNKITTSFSSKFDTTSTTNDELETTMITKKTTDRSKPTRVLESPTRDITESYKKNVIQSPPRTTSPSKMIKDGSPVRKSTSPNRTLESDYLSDGHLKRDDDVTRSRPRKTSDKTPGYMKTTTTNTYKCDKTSTTVNTEESYIRAQEKKDVTQKKSATSPTRQMKQSAPRVVSPTKSSRPELSPQRKPTEDATAKKSKHPDEKIPNSTKQLELPGYMKTTTAATTKVDTKTKTEEKKDTSLSPSVSPTRKFSQPKPTPEQRTPSPTKLTHPSDISFDRKSSKPQQLSSPNKESPGNKIGAKYPKDHSPTRKDSENLPGYMKSTASVTTKYEAAEYDSTTTQNVQETISSRTTENIHPKPRNSESPQRHNTKYTDESAPENLRTTSPSKSLQPPKHQDMPLDRKLGNQPKTTNEHYKRLSPEETSDYYNEKSKIAVNTKFVTSEIPSKDDSTFDNHSRTHSPVKLTGKKPSSRKSESPDHHSPERQSLENLICLTEHEEPKQLRTPSPIKKTKLVVESNNDFIMSEREQEILNKVQKSLRKLSPERKERSPSRERSVNKTTTSLQDLDIITSESIQTDKVTDENLADIVEEQIKTTSKITHSRQPKEFKSNEQKIPSKTSTRNVSPIKKTPMTTVSSKTEKSPVSPTKSRSISPKKPFSPVERPHSPQVPKVSGIKPREQIPPYLTRKPTPATLSPIKTDKISTDVKKSNAVIKQNVITKVTTSRSIHSPTSKCSETEPKRIPTPKGVKENVISKKDAITRTASDIGMKPKKTSSPQRMKSKPEIQISDMSTKYAKTQNTLIKEPHSKLPSKPKSATSLNTSTDDDDIIIDVQLSKSSRENSPDRICPTPVNFSDDIGTPRFPDEVSEPDDDFVKRTYHTIHETESVVDDIVEICEDEELFTKKSDMDVLTDHDDSLLSVNDKVNKFTSKIQSVTRPKDATTLFKNTEKRVHSDFVDENLKSDECLLTVSEKVNRFAKGTRDAKDSRSPSRKITEEYDNDTVYQDDYTKLSVNDKAHLFVETAENVKVTKVKAAQKIERPVLLHVDESLKSDDCLLSVSDKVNKFVKTAEKYLTESQVNEDTENKIKEQHENIIKQIVDYDNESYDVKTTIHTEENDTVNEKSTISRENKLNLQRKEPKTSQPSVNVQGNTAKPAERVPAVKITTLRSSEAVKKAKALFENISSTQKTTQKDTIHSIKTTKLTDIGVIKNSPNTNSTTVLHPSPELEQSTYPDREVDVSPSTRDDPLIGTPSKPQYSHVEEKPRSSPNRLTAQSPEVPRSKSPMRQSVEVNTKASSVLSRYPAVTRAESPRQRPESPRQRTESPRQRLPTESDKLDKVPGYLRPTKTSQIKEEIKVVEDSEVSSRRGSGKFGVELRRTSVERSTISSERRRSVEHHQPCIEDIFDLDLLEQMLEKVVGYEQRRRIRAQIRIAKTQSELVVDTNTYTRTSKQTTTKNRSPERKVHTSSDTATKSALQKTLSPDRHNKTTPHKTIPDRTQPKEPTMNGHPKEPTKTTTVTRQRPHSPEKAGQKSTLAPKAPIRQPSPDKRRTVSPSKAVSKPKGNRFNEYASAYMKKVGLNESDKIKFSDTKTKKTTDTKQIKHERQQETVQEFTATKSFTERTSSKDVIEIIQTNGKRSPSPEQRKSPERKVQFPERTIKVSEERAHCIERKTQSPIRKAQSPESPVHSPESREYSPERKAKSPERLHQRTPSPDFKRPKSNTAKETITKTVYDIEKKIPAKSVPEEKPSWVTNRNLKKITSDTRTYSSKKIENEKPKYRAPSPSKVISKPIDVITSSYGPGPLDANGKPLFGIKALRNGASNIQVKGTVIRQEFHSRNGGEPEGTVSVTAYSTQPEELEQLLATQGGEPPSRIHGLAAITTTKKFGGDTGNTLSKVHTKEDRASLEQFTHHDRRVENLESRTYENRTHEFSEDNRREEVVGTTRKDEITESKRRDDHSGNTRRIESRKDEHTDRKDRITRKEEKVTEVKKTQRREDKKTVRQSSVKSLTEKYIKSTNDSGKSDRSTYPKAGLILRTTTMRDSISSDDAHPGLVRTDSEHSLGSGDDTVVTTTERTGDGVCTTTTRTTHHHGPTVTTHTRGSTIITHHDPVITTKKTSTVITQEPVITHRVISHEPVIQKVTRGHGSTTTTERSFLDSNTKVTGVQDILSRMKNADIVIQEGDTTEDSEARALLNKFLGATVLMAGMQGYVNEQPSGKLVVKQETVHSSSGGEKITSRTVEELDLDQCWDERLLKKLLEECTDYEQRRRLRARIRTLMAEQEACASAVTEALGAAGADNGDASDAREEEEVTMTSSVRRDSSDKTVSSSTTTKTSKVIEMTRSAPKPVSPFAKFRQLEKQNSTNSPNSPKTPQSPGSPSQPYFKFTDPALQCSALTIKERLLQWCRDKTRDYENVKLENFSTSWADGLAFCALVHHFMPDAFDYSKLTADKRRHNFTLAFKVADEKAGIYPLLDVDDMVAMRKPDWKCVFTYVQAIYRRFKDEQ